MFPRFMKFTLHGYDFVWGAGIVNKVLIPLTLECRHHQLYKLYNLYGQYYRPFGWT